MNKEIVIEGNGAKTNNKISKSKKMVTKKSIQDAQGSGFHRGVNGRCGSELYRKDRGGVKDAAPGVQTSGRGGAGSGGEANVPVGVCVSI